MSLAFREIDGPKRHICAGGAGEDVAVGAQCVGKKFRDVACGTLCARLRRAFIEPRRIDKVGFFHADLLRERIHAPHGRVGFRALRVLGREKRTSGFGKCFGTRIG